MVDPGGLKEATAFKRIHLLGFLYFCDGKLTGLWIRVNDFKWFSGGNAIGGMMDIQVESEETSSPTER